MIDEHSLLWQYLSPKQRVLAGDGNFLIHDSNEHKDQEPTDYSYLVFPFAKMYEGFLKQLFLDIGIISEHDYASERFRIGKALSPTLAHRLGKYSAFTQIESKYGRDLALMLWQTWKEGRNLVFHYFPHNYRALPRDKALQLIQKILETMEEAVVETKVRMRGGDSEYPDSM